MIIKRLDTGTVTMTGVDGGALTSTIGKIYGRILKMDIKCSASSDLWLYADASVTDHHSNDEDLLGATGSKITVNTALTIYPVKAQYLTTNAITDPDQYTYPIVDGTIMAGWANVADNDTFRITIWYEPFD